MRKIILSVLLLTSFFAQANELELVIGVSKNYGETVYSENELHSPVGTFGLNYTPKSFKNFELFFLHISSIPAVRDNHSGINLLGCSFKVKLF